MKLWLKLAFTALPGNLAESQTFTVKPLIKSS